jgi:hypothetical protein
MEVLEQMPKIGNALKAMFENTLRGLAVSQLELQTPASLDQAHEAMNKALQARHSSITVT